MITDIAYERNDSRISSSIVTVERGCLMSSIGYVLQFGRSGISWGRIGTALLDVEVAHVERVLLDEPPPRLDLVAHQRRKDLVGLVGVFDSHLQQDPRVWVHGRLPQLLGIHLAEPLEALDLEAVSRLAHQLGDGLAERARRLFAVARAQAERG